jgi:hypothetical protein
MILLWTTSVWLFYFFLTLLVKGHSVQTNEPLEYLLFPMLYGLCHEFGLLGRLTNAGLLQLFNTSSQPVSLYQEVFNEIINASFQKSSSY